MRTAVAYLHYVATEFTGLFFGLGAEWSAEMTSRRYCQIDLADTPPADVMEARRVQWTLRRMEHAIAHHQFQQARFYSDQERKEREYRRGLET